MTVTPLSDGQSLDLPGIREEGERTPLREGTSRVLEHELYGGITAYMIQTTTVKPLMIKNGIKG